MMMGCIGKADIWMMTRKIETTASTRSREADDASKMIWAAKRKNILCERFISAASIHYLTRRVTSSYGARCRIYAVLSIKQPRKQRLCVGHCGNSIKGWFWALPNFYNL
jgi:hypothetical protein